MKRAMHTVGVVGLGLVGGALARRLLAAGYSVRGYDIDPKCRSMLAEAGGDAVIGVKEALACPTVLLAVYDDAQITSVLANDVPAGTVIVDTVTGDPQFAATLATDLRLRCVHYIDAPLSGSSVQIGNGEGIALLGGEPSVIETQRALFATIACTATHFGGAGSGRAAKLASNLILGLNRAAFAEGLAFAERLGLDASKFSAMIADSPARSAAAQAKAPRMLSHDYVPESRIRQHRKDLELMALAASRCGASLTLTAAHATVLDSAIAAGHGDLDNAAVIEHYRRLDRRAREGGDPASLPRRDTGFPPSRE